jgi:hypothetical protein
MAVNRGTELGEWKGFLHLPPLLEFVHEDITADGGGVLEVLTFPFHSFDP